MQASDAMTSRLPRYEVKCVQRRYFQCGSVPLRSDIKGTAVRQSRRGQVFTLSLRIRRVIRRHARHVTLRVGQRYERLRSNTDTIYTRTPPVEAPSQ